MRSLRFNILTITLLFWGLTACRKPYNPPATSSPNSYLVVEGLINAGADSTIIKLSRTVNLSSGVAINPVSGAILTVESKAGDTYPLNETSNGSYSTKGLNLNIAGQYRLHISTGSQQYMSDFIGVKIAPAIDSIGFTIQGNALQLYLNSHDAQNGTRYYRWDYEETWQFHALYFSSYITNGSSIVPRTSAQLIYSCFGSDSSTTIILGSSAQLAQDVISQAPLTSILSTSEKIETKYSIIVHQYALTKDEFNFYTNLKKNTEQLGTIFDAQPSEITGNIHNINNALEPVIGYISAGTVQSKRIFINNSQLPSVWHPTYPYQCQQDSDFFADPKSSPPQNEVAADLIPLGSAVIPTSQFTLPNAFPPSGYLGASVECVDCTLRGTKITPPFWK